VNISFQSNFQEKNILFIFGSNIKIIFLMIVEEENPLLCQVIFLLHDD
jgi:hypothetical protein